MAAPKPAVCVVSQCPERGEDLKSLIDAIGSLRCIVAPSAKRLFSIGEERGVRVALLDRGLDTEELKRLADAGERYDLVTFGCADSTSAPLVQIESVASYQLRHPVERNDLERVFGHLSGAARSPAHWVSARSQHLYRGLVGDSAAARQLRELIEKIALSKSTVLITGETGTGKEIVARNIHYRSRHGAGPFVAVNCAAIPPDLLESELFGHKKGAFTGALSNRQGRFTLAAEGTLFLDEIGDMTPSLQVKLLRVLEERIIYRVGCNKPIAMTARLVAATHRNLEECVARGQFREDLFYRLNVVPVTVPPLRARKEDIPQLAKELGCRLQREQDITVELTPAAVERLQAYDWPGNVRELANLIERLAVIHPNGIADAGDLPNRYKDSAAASDQTVLSHSLAPQVMPEDGIDLKGFLRSTEAALIRQALTHSGGTMSQAATLLHVGRTTLTEKVKRLGLSDLVKSAGS